MWSLKVVTGAELADKLQPEVRLPQPLQRFTIGRDPVNSWPIADRTLAISGRHCEIVATPEGPALRDLSTNGTFVNGAATRLAGLHVLRDGDRIELGPFSIGISGPPMPTRTAALAVPAVSTPAGATAPRSTGVHDTVPQRGGDPAAMAAMAARGQAQARAGLTEILRVASPSDDTDGELTKIRLAPVPTSAASRVVPPPPSPPVSTPALPPLAPAASPAVTAAALIQALARGLGLPVSALEGENPLQLAQQIALTARAATAALQQLVEHQAQQRQQAAIHLSVGSLQTPPPMSQAAQPLRAGARLDPALLALALARADPLVVMQRSADELCEHEDRLLQALAARRGSLPG